MRTAGKEALDGWSRRRFLEQCGRWGVGSLVTAGAGADLFAGAGRATAQEGVPPPASLEWWRAGRLGIFIHWGPVSLRGTEIGWSRGAEVPIAEYDQLYRSFRPVGFDARAWARLFREAGARYVVFTSKHHDGFCMWHTRWTDYSIAHTPFGRDVVAELARACRAEGLVFCLYHSICDWRHPDYPLGSPGGKTIKPVADMSRYEGYLRNQLTELLTAYGRLGVLWFDGEWEAPWTEAQGVALYRFCRSLQPELIINNRVAKARNDMEGTSRRGMFAGDYDTPEQRVGTFQRDRPWESCITVGRQWSWKPGDQLKSDAECVETLVRTVGGDGNLLLNVGPTPEGEIEPRQAELLRGLGRWLRGHGATVYGTRGGPFLPGSWGVSTCRGRTVYLHVLRPGLEQLVLPPIPAGIRGAFGMEDGRRLPWRRSGFTTIRLPGGGWGGVGRWVRVELDRPAIEMPLLPLPAEPS